MFQKRRILLVSDAFYPEISPRSFRATELVKEYYRQGHDVTIITRHRNDDYTEFLNEFPVSFKMWEKQSYPNIPVNGKGPISFLLKAISRILSVLFEYPAVEKMYRVRNILRSEEGYDLMISFAVPFPVHWGVASVRTAKMPIAKVWVADCGDPYMFARLDRFRKPFYFKFREMKFCRKCNFITVPFDDLRNQFYPEFNSKIMVIPQGFNFQEINLFKEQVKNDKPVFIFAGSLIPGKRDLAQFLDFLTSVSMDFRFIVYTKQQGWFNKYKDRMGERLLLNNYIGRLILIYEMSKADFLVNVDTIHDDPSNVEAVPSKLIDYALSGRPILNIHSGHLDEEKIIEFLNKDYSRQRHIEISKYDIKEVTAKFLELVQ